MLEWELPEICTVLLPVVLLILNLIAEHKHSALVKLIVHEANDATRCLLGLQLAQLALEVELTLHNAVCANDADYAEGLEKRQLCLDLIRIVILLLLIGPSICLRQFLELHVALLLGAFLDDHLANVAQRIMLIFVILIFVFEIERLNPTTIKILILRINLMIDRLPYRPAKVIIRFL